MSRVTVEELLDELYEVIERAPRVPLGGKCIVSSEEVKSILDELRGNLPKEIGQARAIVADRGRILGDARMESEAIIRTAEDRARMLVSQDAVVREAQNRAVDIVEEAQEKSRQIRKATNDYVEEVMLKADDSVTALLTELRQTRQSIKAAQKRE